MQVLAVFAKALSASAHSEAEVERHFKEMNRVLTKYRSSLKSENVDNTLVVKINRRELHPEHHKSFHNKAAKRKRD